MSMSNQQDQRDQRFMRWALRLAARASGETRPNPLVGALLVHGDRVVGKGFHRRAGGPHAEREALQQAGDQARGATAYVTLEPCSHTGRTPPCCDALIRSGVQRVVTAMQDPNPKVAGGGILRLREAGVTVDVGLCEEEARALNRPFITWIQKKRPMVTVKSAMSLDGKIATRTGESQWITGVEARRQAHRLRAVHDLVMVGVGTLLADNPRLTVRNAGGRDPIRLIVDSTLRTPPEAAIFTASRTAPVWIATTDRSDPVKRRMFESRQEHVRSPVTLLNCARDSRGRVDLEDLLRQLGEREITSLLSESGGALTESLLAGRLADRAVFFVAPMLIGGRDAPGLLHGMGTSHLKAAPRLIRQNLSSVGDDWMVSGDLCYNQGGL